MKIRFYSSSKTVFPQNFVEDVETYHWKGQQEFTNFTWCRGLVFQGSWKPFIKIVMWNLWKEDHIDIENEHHENHKTPFVRIGPHTHNWKMAHCTQHPGWVGQLGTSQESISRKRCSWLVGHVVKSGAVVQSYDHSNISSQAQSGSSNHYHMADLELHIRVSQNTFCTP